MSGLADDEVTGFVAPAFLLTAYPDEQERSRAARWLGLLAAGAADDGRLCWWLIPAVAPAAPVIIVRRVLLAALAAAALGAGLAVSTRENGAGAVGYGSALLVIAAVLFGSVRLGRWRLPRTLRRPAPRAALARGATPAGSYRAERAACLRTGLACAPAGLLLGALAGWGTRGGPWVMAGDAVAAVVAGTFLRGSYPLVTFSELVLAAAWEERPRFVPVLEGAARRGLLRPDGAGYAFRDDAVAAWFVAAGQAARAAQAALLARRLAGPGLRARLARGLRAHAARAGIDTGAGAAAATAGLVFARLAKFGIGHGNWPAIPGALLLCAVVAGAGGALAWGGSLGVARIGAGSVALLPLTRRRGRVAAGGGAVAAAVVVTALAGPVLAGVVAFALPAAFVLACGGWACALAARRTRGRPRVQRGAVDVLAAATAGGLACVLADRRLLTALPATGLLFPLAAWAAFRLWARMSASARLLLRAAADVVLALLLGATGVLALVWLADVLAMPPAELAAVRGILARSGGLADLPWWVWTGAWLTLAAAGLALVRWPRRLRRAGQRFERWRVVAVAEVTERVLSGVHVGLLTLVFVGLAAPPAVVPVLGRQLRASYQVAYQRELAAAAEVAAYEAIARQFAAQPPSPVLARMLTKLHDVSPPDQAGQASGSEAENARRLGESAGAALALTAPSLEPAVQAAAAAAGESGAPARPTGLDARAAAAQHEVVAAAAAAKRVGVAADLAVKVVASLIAVPRLSDHEVVAVVREYLAGLVEDSPLKETFTAWIERLPGATAPPDAAAVVIPAPSRLERAAAVELAGEFAAVGGDDPALDPFDDPALDHALKEDPLDGAVDLVNQARYANDRSAPCTGCSLPHRNRQPGEGPEDEHPLEP